MFNILALQEKKSKERQAILSEKKKKINPFVSPEKLKSESKMLYYCNSAKRFSNINNLNTQSTSQISSFNKQFENRSYSNDSSEVFSDKKIRINRNPNDNLRQQANSQNQKKSIFSKSQCFLTQSKSPNHSGLQISPKLNKTS